MVNSWSRKGGAWMQLSWILTALLALLEKTKTKLETTGLDAWLMKTLFTLIHNKNSRWNWDAASTVCTMLRWSFGEVGGKDASVHLVSATVRDRHSKIRYALLTKEWNMKSKSTKSEIVGESLWKTKIPYSLIYR